MEDRSPEKLELSANAIDHKFSKYLDTFLYEAANTAKADHVFLARYCLFICCLVGKGLASIASFTPYFWLLLFTLSNLHDLLIEEQLIANSSFYVLFFTYIKL